MEKYPRGRRGSPAKGVVRETVARVQIPPSPPRETVARVQIPPSPPLVNNTNSENGFVLFFAADFFGVIVERNYKSQPKQRAD